MSKFEIKLFNFKVPLPFPRKGTIVFGKGEHDIFVPIRIRKRSHVYYYMETPDGEHGCGHSHSRELNELFYVQQEETGFFVKIRVESEWLKFHWYIR